MKWRSRVDRRYVPRNPRSAMPDRIEPFTIHVPDAVLRDLDDRLARTAWPDEPDGGGWDYGTDRATLQALVAHWREGFSWREQEARLNAVPHFRTTIGG